MNGLKYCLAEISHVPALVPTYRVLRIIPDQRFIPYVLCQ
jgi:hypothetical protein